MQPSPIQFLGSKFERIEFAGDGVLAERVMPGIRYKINTVPEPDSGNRLWASTMHIELFDPGVPGQQSVCTGRFAISGRFEVMLPSEQMSLAPEIIASNAPAMLYSSVRELAYALAVRIGVFGFILPTVYFQKLADEGVFGSEGEQSALPLAGEA